MPNDVPQLIADVRRRTNVTDTAILSDDDITECVNAAQERMLMTGALWRNLEQRDEFTYYSTDDGHPLPINCQGLAAVWQATTTGAPSDRLSPVTNITREMWVNRVSAVDTSRDFPMPSITGLFYYLWEERIFLVPNPTSTAGTPIVLDFYGPPPDLTKSGAGASNFFTRFYYRTLRWGTLFEVYDHLDWMERRMEADARFKEQLERATARETQLRSLGPKKQRGI